MVLNQMKAAHPHKSIFIFEFSKIIWKQSVFNRFLTKKTFSENEKKYLIAKIVGNSG